MSGNAETVTIIEPRKGWIPIDLKEIWAYRELLYFLTKRDITVRYKQTVLGGLWAIIQPFFTMVVFTLFFGRMAKMPSDGIPYPIFNILLFFFSDSPMTNWSSYSRMGTISGSICRGTI